MEIVVLKVVQNNAAAEVVAVFGLLQLSQPK
jgi:hypothetical protein